MALISLTTQYIVYYIHFLLSQREKRNANVFPNILSCSGTCYSVRATKFKKAWFLLRVTSTFFFSLKSFVSLYSRRSYFHWMGKKCYTNGRISESEANFVPYFIHLFANESIFCCFRLLIHIHFVPYLTNSFWFGDISFSLFFAIWLRNFFTWTIQFFLLLKQPQWNLFNMNCLYSKLAKCQAALDKHSENNFDNFIVSNEKGKFIWKIDLSKSSQFQLLFIGSIPRNNNRVVGYEMTFWFTKVEHVNR